MENNISKICLHLSIQQMQAHWGEIKREKKENENF